MATSVVACALATAVTASPAVAVPDPSATTAASSVAMRLTGSDSANPFQSALDQIVAAQQQIIETNSAYPFITDFDKTLLPEYVQSAALMQLYLNLGQLNFANGYDPEADRFPYLWNASAAEPQNFMNYPNPDTQYYFTPLGDKTEVITVDPGPGTESMTFTVMSGTGTPSGFTSLHAYDLSQFTPNPDGTYTIYVTPTEHAGNWVDASGGQTLAIRDTIGDWGLLHNTMDIELKDQPGFALPVLSDDQISSMLTNIAEDLPDANASSLLYGVQHATASIPANFITPIRGTIDASPGGPLLPGQFGSGAHFVLEDDQALILKVPVLEAAYSGISLDNAWSAGAPAAIAQSSLNNTQAFYGPNDGFIYYVVSNQDPGVPNWLDTSGLNDGAVILRWQGVTEAVPPTPPHAEVVNIADVRDYLPEGTPVVTPAERAADLHERLLEYYYVQHQDYDSGWVTANLEYDQIKDAVGAEQFYEIFGSQQDVPTVLDRLTSPALSPDLIAIANEILTNPADSLAAIINNLPLAIKDIELPMVLAALRLEMAVGETLQAVQTDISSGEFAQAWAALGSGLQDLGTVFDATWTDPATSISAGFLNARDDLAVSIMNADSYSLSDLDFASLGVQLNQLDESVSEMLSAGWSYLLDSIG